jgi:hypothetical protein
MIIIELFSNSVATKNAKVQTIGALIQGIYIWYSYGKIDVKYFILYIFLTFILSLIYYKVFLGEQ